MLPRGTATPQSTPASARRGLPPVALLCPAPDSPGVPAQAPPAPLRLSQTSHPPPPAHTLAAPPPSGPGSHVATCCHSHRIGCDVPEGTGSPRRPAGHAQDTSSRMRTAGSRTAAGARHLRDLLPPARLLPDDLDTSSSTDSRDRARRRRDAAEDTRPRSPPPSPSAPRGLGTRRALAEAAATMASPGRSSPAVTSWRIPLTETRALRTGLPNLSTTMPLMPRCAWRGDEGTDVTRVAGPPRVPPSRASRPPLRAAAPSSAKRG